MARPGLTLAAGAGVASGGLLGATALALVQRGPQTTPLHQLGGVLAAVAVLGLAAGLVLERPQVVPVALALVAADYALVLLGAPRSVPGATAAAPLVAGALFAAAELGWWSAELRRGAREAPAAVLRRLAQIGGLAVASVLLAAGCILAGGAVLLSGVIPTAVGVAAASCVLGLAAWLAARGAQA